MPKKTKKKTPAITPAESEATNVKDAISELDRLTSGHSFTPQFFQVPTGDYIIIPRGHYDMLWNYWCQHHTFPCSPEQQAATRIKASLEREARREPPTEEQVKVELNRLQVDFPELGEFIKQVHAEVEAKKKGKEGGNDTNMDRKD